MEEKDVLERRPVFCRIGWAERYRGDEDLTGGGKFNQENIGGEIWNYLPHKGKLYGFFHTGANSGSVNIKRIPGNDGEKCKGVTVIFVATHPKEGGQRVVGWYRNATVYKKPQEWRSDERGDWTAEADEDKSVLLPCSKREIEVPSDGKGRMGQSNVRYILDNRGEPDVPSWASKVLEYIEQYSGPNLLVDPDANEVDTFVKEAEAARAGQGRLSSEEQRKVEEHAVQCACEHLEREGYEHIDTSPQSTKPYDIKCKKGNQDITVEVKGTTGCGDCIILTRNEVKHARDNADRHMLLVVYGISLKMEDQHEASEGEVQRVGPPFNPDKGNLDPIAYDYTIHENACVKK